MHAGAELPPLKLARAAYLLGYAALALVALVSLLPVPQAVAGGDKLLHFVTYFGLSAGFSVLVCRPRSLYLVGFGLIIYGAVLEWLQSLTGYRYLEYLDMLANSCGVLVGLFIRFSPFPAWVRRLEQRWMASV